MNDLEKIRDLAAEHALDGGTGLMEQEIAAMSDALAAMARGHATQTGPSASLRSRVMDRIKASPKVRKPETDRMPDGFSLVRRGPEGWIDGPLPGSKFKQLGASPGQDYVMVMMELAAGTNYPEHDHLGAEELYLVSGDLETEGHQLRPGDHLHADAGTHHSGLKTRGGCVALMVVSLAAFTASM